MLQLLACLQKTAPPVLVFAENKRDVDEIQEYLLLKGIACCSIHGGKSQEERNEAIQDYKNQTKDVLIATDIAAKGLDFPDIQHVINFDMPKELENYVHRIGRTGRRGKTGVATTFINKNTDESTLIDLKHLLMEAGQTVPAILMALDDPAAAYLQSGDVASNVCPVCSGFHRITECPKLDKQRRQAAPRRDAIRSGGGER
jgi:ATP-dependent RNA helicase DDX41